MVTDVVVLIFASVNLGHVARMFIYANGSRPFISGYLVASLLLGGMALSGLFNYDEWVLPTLRTGLAGTLTGTLLWASFRGGKSGDPHVEP